MGFSLLFGSCLAFFACGQSPGTGTSLAGSSSSGVMRACDEIYLDGDPCDSCLYESCCAELSVCDDDCVNCLLGGSSCGKTSNAVFKCADKFCLIECSGHPSTTSSSSGGVSGSTSSSGTGGHTSSSGDGGDGGAGQ
jgi:hypothetical protein